MVKKKVGGGKRYKAVANAKAQGLSEPKWDGPAPPLHIQKKLTRKVQFLDKVSANASTLAAKSGGVNKKTGRKKALPDLSTLGAVLDEVAQRGAGAGGGKEGKEEKKQRGASVNSAKQRQHILLEESQRMQQVLRHPLYKADPIAAITNHLQHTLPPPPPAPKSAPGKPGKKKNNKAGKGKAAGDSMED